MPSPAKLLSHLTIHGTFTGITAAPTGTVLIYANGAQLGVTTLHTVGSFVYTTSAITNGTYAITDVRANEL